MRGGSILVLGLLGLASGLACDTTQPAPGRTSQVVASDGDAVAGLTLSQTLRCARCHLDAPTAPEAARLHDAGARLRPAYLREALVAHDPAIALEPNEAAYLVQFLAGLGEPIAATPVDVEIGQLEAGRQLYHRVGCVACHEPYEDAETLDRPLWAFEDVLSAKIEASVSAAPLPFEGLREKTSASALARYLEDPLAVHPGGEMPSLRLTRSESEAIATYLLFEQAVDAGFVLEQRGGLLAELFEGRFDQATMQFPDPEPVRREIVQDLGALPEHPEDQFGFVFRGFVTTPRDGIYLFATTSDDGSWLYIDGELVVDNGGTHPMTRKEGELWLGAGRHAIEVVCFEHGGDQGLEVSWEGPGFTDEVLAAPALSHWGGALQPPEVEPFPREGRAAERGRELFGSIGCQACHPLPGMPAAVAARPLTAAAWGSSDGCLAETARPGLPHYSLTDVERRALSAAAQVDPGADPRLAVEVAFGRFDCAACHDRGGEGGPSGDKGPYFFVDTDADLGEEGRIPPTLEGVGSKLTEDWIHEVLVYGGSVRPYMETRMPQFGAANVEGLAAALVAADRKPGDDDEPEFTVEAVEAGQRLVGTDGLGCIQCHDFAGNPSLGIPAVDLALVSGRIRPAWFEQLLLDPGALKMNTRMPSFMSDGLSPITDVYDGDPERQADAIWTYLSLGEAMPYPEGLLPKEEEYELEPLEGPISCMVFMEGVSPRTVLVGFPQRTHYAFDIENSRLAKVWRGRFFNARGTWHERAGQLENPPSLDVHEFPRGATFARLAEPNAEWPVELGREAGYRARGRTYTADRTPTFRYAFGELAIEETAVPDLRAGGTWIRRSFVFDGDTKGLVMRAAVGGTVETREGGEIVVFGDDGLRMRIDGAGWYVTPRQDGLVEVRVPVDGQDTLEVEVSW